jgi:hypothetical protein
MSSGIERGHGLESRAHPLELRSAYRRGQQGSRTMRWMNSGMRPGRKNDSLREVLVTIGWSPDAIQFMLHLPTATLCEDGRRPAKIPWPHD